MSNAQLLCFLFASMATMHAQAPAAFVQVSEGSLVAEIMLDREPKSCTDAQVAGCGITVTLFQGGVPLGSATHLARAPWRMPLPAEFRRGNAARVLIQAYRDTSENPQPERLIDLSLGFTVDQRTASKDADGNLVPGLVRCNIREGEWLGVLVEFDPRIGVDYARSRLRMLDAWSKPHQSDPGAVVAAEFEIGTDDVIRPPLRAATFQSPNFTAAPNALLQWSGCLAPGIPPPVEAFRSRLTFAAGAPFELAEPLIQEKGQGIKAIAALQADFKSKVGERTFERDLDLGLALTSGLEKVTQADGKSLLQRRTRGSIDLRLVPVRDWKPLRRQRPRQKLEARRDQEWFATWSPVFLDARVATGRIEAGSAALNVIAFGTQVELLYQPRNQSRTYRNWHRFILRGINASDRDFKQAEVRVNPEYSPVLGIWNRPLATRLKVDEAHIGASTFRLVPSSRFGYRFLPVTGADLGSTWRRHNPAAAVKPPDNLVRRFYFGGELTLEVTPRITFSTKDRFYLRGEEPLNRTRNYFKSEALLQLGGYSANIGHGISVSFERGALPPFTSDANAFVLGYRVLLQRWN